MFITVNELPKVINDYLVDVIIPKMPSGVLKFGLGFASSYITNNALAQFMTTYGQVAVAIGIINENKIDVNMFRENALKAISMCDNHHFEYMGYKFDTEDVEALYKIMTTYAK